MVAMTTTPASTAPTTSAPSTSTGDPRAVFAAAVTTATDVVDNVRADQFDAPTPCTDYDVRDLLGHLALVVRRVAAVGRGEHPMTVLEGTVTVDDQWRDTWRREVDACEAAWRDGTALTQEVHFPWADLDGAGTLLMYTSELSVHTWDLATATGQRPAWDDDVLAQALEMQHHVLPSAQRAAQYEQIRAGLPDGVEWRGDPFRDAVPVADDAPLIDRLVAWSGRQP
jgi:uncharacterized protein (TIGR03086 family)